MKSATRLGALPLTIIPLILYLHLTPALAKCDTQEDFDAAMAVLTTQVESNLGPGSAVLPQFVRAAFHDCITAIRPLRSSGCNGSLRLREEMRHSSNRGLGMAVRLAVNISSQTCLSVADVIQGGMAVSVVRAGGPDVLSDVLSFENQREDADVPDMEVIPPRGEEGILTLPGRNDDYATLAAFYKGKGFTWRDLIGSLAGAHSLGGFAEEDPPRPPTPGCPPPPPGPPRARRPFTPDARNVSASYAENLVARSEVASGPVCNLPRFHTLPSDEAMVTDARTLRRLKRYVRSIGALHADFGTFLVKNSRLTGRTVGRARRLK